MRWDPEQYVRFADERGRGYFELLARVGLDAPSRVVDIGCGPGGLTEALVQRWPDARIEGIDSSPDMIEKASARATDRLTFRVGDAAAWTMPADVDLVVSNATLQWVPGHLDVLNRWASQLSAGAWLAFQVPGNFGSPSHRLMREIAATSRWKDTLDGVLRHDDAVAEPAVYADLLLAAGLQVDVWETTYLHVLQGSDPVLEWVRGTGLRPVLQALSGDDAAEFEREYAAALRDAYPATERGALFPFRRTFAVAHRALGG